MSIKTCIQVILLSPPEIMGVRAEWHRDEERFRNHIPALNPFCLERFKLNYSRIFCSRLTLLRRTEDAAAECRGYIIS